MENARPGFGAEGATVMSVLLGGSELGIIINIGSISSLWPELYGEGRFSPPTTTVPETLGLIAGGGS